MNVLIVYAHPEPKSLNSKLFSVAFDTLTENGHQVKVSDLYEMKFKAVLDDEDFPERMNEEIFNPIIEQQYAVKTGAIPDDIKEEMDKVEWADLVIFQFPIWWTSFPAIMKGWIDRVFANGFVFNLAEYKVYTDGLLNGKKAMLSFTTGAPRELYSQGGPHGDIDQLLTYMTHCMFEFVGMEVLPLFGLFGTASMSEEEINIQIDKFKNVLKSI
ncbi:MAG: NAD(P)H-dependent oxidoreductase [Methanobacterium sp.]|uniref:NAD(P)H-dependent oxidoreductase n=1 Tax=Methanobacterium sp. TaxID=2164 RepID=UPI003D65D864|nr:NAD(P)H-dependent oxidoreductase [Methanobacterium sp.]